jgi:radical SAM superfamily enzyme YgiQ (UPF0313 family)
MKVCLINPPVRNQKNWVREGRCQQLDIWGAPFPPFTLAMTSRRLVDRGCETIIIDGGPEGKSAEEVITQVSKFQPDYIVMSASTPTIDSDLGWFLPQLKSALPKIPVAAIGVHVTALPKETLETFTDLDYVVLSEPETVIGDLFSKPLNADRLPETLGLGYRVSPSEVRINPPREFEEDLDSLGIPDWEKVDLNKYIMPIRGKPFSLVHFARGCPHKCSFCTAHSFNGRGFRKRSIPSLIQEIEFNISLGVQDFLFWTELLTADAKYLDSFLEAVIEKGLDKKIRWVCNSRVDTVNLDMLKKMKRAGCWQVAFGFDFGTDKMLKLTQKGGRASIELGLAAARMAQEAGLVVDGHFILGYPGETPEDVEKTIEFAMKAPITFGHFYPAVPYPGSQLYTEWLKSQPKNLGDSPWRKFDQSDAVIDAPGLSNKQVVAYKKSAYRGFYLRPQVLKRVFSIPNSVPEYLNLVKAGVHTVTTLLFWRE